jgi:hypothetical protein
MSEAVEMAWPPEYLDHHAGRGPGVGGALTVDRGVAAGSASAAAS